MFCFIPVPYHLWDEQCVNLVLPCFPLVGALIGVLWLGIAKLLNVSGVHPVLAAAVTAVAPFVLSGLLHLDGFADTCDAIMSRRPAEEKLRILKDPHMGVFSTAALCMIVILQFASVYATLDMDKNITPLALIPVISRGCASAAILFLDALPESGYGKLFKENTGLSHKLFVIAVIIAAVCLSAVYAGLYGLIASAAVILGYAGSMGIAYREFHGVSGDLAGYAIVIGELCGLLLMGVAVCC